MLKKAFHVLPVVIEDIDDAVNQWVGLLRKVSKKKPS